MKIKFNNMSEEMQILLRVSISTIRSAIGMLALKYAMLMTNTPELYSFFSGLVDGKTIPLVLAVFIGYGAAILLSMVGIFLLTPLGSLIAFGLLSETFGSKELYKKSKRIFHTLKKVFLW